MAIINIRNLDDTLRNEYKGICAIKGVSMTEDIINYIKWVVEHRKIITEKEEQKQPE